MSQQFHFQDLFNIYENICLNKDFYMDVEGNIILNSQNWKQSKCPSTGEETNNLWYIHTMEYYPAIERINYRNKRMNLNNNKKTVYYMKEALYMMVHINCSNYVECQWALEISWGTVCKVYDYLATNAVDLKPI